jgi:hypothetical protein
MTDDIIQDIHDLPLNQRIALCIKYASLDYKWIIRNYLSNCSRKLPKNDPRVDRSLTTRTKGIYCPPNRLSEREDALLFQLANSTFDYLAKWQKTFSQEESLGAITEMCANNDLKLNVLKQDDQLYFLSRVFNKMAGSTRGLYKCYDCGTNARAMFLRLIKKHRDNDRHLFLSLDEQKRLRSEYLSYDDRKPSAVAKKCLDDLLKCPTSGVFILSLGFDNFGHVWIIEKIVRRGLPDRYQQYQSCFRSHMVLDFLAYKNYGEFPHQSIGDITDSRKSTQLAIMKGVTSFFTDLIHLFDLKGPWTNKDYAIFSKLFAFLPVYPIKEGRPSFSYTSVIY